MRPAGDIGQPGDEDEQRSQNDGQRITAWEVGVLGEQFAGGGEADGQEHAGEGEGENLGDGDDEVREEEGGPARW